ncbi:uncharacterized protein [Nicotiana sylvestris]|uniref:uncharacterized protein n=1 Tax=Nicotiana sylvestris TaxID=4096 RepID=UPI00388C45B3
MADHLSHLEEEGRPNDGLEINDSFLDEQLLFMSLTRMPWFADVAKYLRCVPEEEQLGILEACRSSAYGGHMCDDRQRADGISKKNEMPLTTILEIDIFDVWGIDFMGPFVSSCGNTYILVTVYYVSKWVDVLALPNNETRSVVTFLKKNIFTKFGTPRAIISDVGSQFCNKSFDTLLSKYGVTHKVSTPITPGKWIG